MPATLVVNSTDYEYPLAGEPHWRPSVTTWAQAVSTYMLQKAGGTLTGPLILAADPLVALGAATKQYVDNSIAGSLTIADTATIDLTLTLGQLTADVKATSISNSQIAAAAGIALNKLAATTASKALVSDASGFVSASSVTPTELALLAGATTKPSKELFQHFADVANGTTVETDLYSDTIATAQLANNGEKLIAQYGGTFVGDATSTQQLKAYFGGTQVFDSGALGIGVSATYWNLSITIIRESASIVRVTASLTTSFASFSSYATYTKVTGLTLANTQVCKITGTAAGVTGASNQIIASEGMIQWRAAA